MNWFTRLFTVSKRTDPAMAAIEQPALDAAHTAVGGVVTSATSAINPALDELATAGEAMLDTYLAKLGIAGQVLSVAAHPAVAIGKATLEGIIDSKLGLQPGDTVPSAA